MFMGKKNLMSKCDACGFQNNIEGSRNNKKYKVEEKKKEKPVEIDEPIGIYSVKTGK
jgi:hypothetical protein